MELNKDNIKLIEENARSTLSKSKFFNEDFYRRHNPKIKDDDDAITYYIKHNKDELAFPSKYFNPKWYLEHNTDVKDMGIDPLIHFLLFGKDEKRNYRPTEVDFKSIQSDINNIRKMYKTIYNSDLFNIHYYLNENDDIDLKGMDPILHYITIGADKGYNPSKDFNTINYLENIQKIHLSTNPLYHYIVYQFSSQQTYRDEFGKKYRLTGKKYPPKIVEEVTKQLIRETIIILPITTDYTQTSKCIESFLKNTDTNYKLIILNDELLDGKTNTLLYKLKNIKNIKIINTNTDNFINIINMIFSEKNNKDIAILTSNLILTPRWLSKLIVSAYINPSNGAVIPLTNNDIISILKYLPLNLTQKQINQINFNIEHTNYTPQREIPLTTGVCTYIKRETIKKLGKLNTNINITTAISKATAKIPNDGYKIIQSVDTFIYQLKTQDIPEVIQDIYPSLYDKYDNFQKSREHQKDINHIRENVLPLNNGESILYITSLNEEQTPEVDENFYNLAKKYDINIITIDESYLQFFLYDGISEFKQIYQRHLDSKHETTFFNIFTKLKYDAIYMYKVDVEQEIKYYNLINLAEKLEIPVLYPIRNRNIIEEIEEVLNPQKTINELIQCKKDEINPEIKKIVVYTKITKEDDRTILDIAEDENIDHVCFTDDPNLKSDLWKIRYIKSEMADIIKIMPERVLPEYDYSIYIKPSVRIITPIHKLLNNFKSNRLLLPELEPLNNKHIPLEDNIILRNHNIKSVSTTMEKWYELDHTKEGLLEAIKITNLAYDKAPIGYIQKSTNKIDISELDFIKNLYVEEKFDKKTTNRILKKLKEPTTIVIPVYNAYEDTRRCIESVLKNTEIPYEILIINDSSSDSRIAPMLASYNQNYENIKVITNICNYGFVKNVNISFKSTNNDILLLNSDTIVTPNWLMKLKIAAYFKEDIGTVTPLSNNSGAFNVPYINRQNFIKSNLGLEKTANIVEKIDDTLLNTPSGNGFCMYIKRKVINEVGLFDLSFGHGYGEENDFSMRAIEHGYKNVVDTSTYIYHNESASFGSNKIKLMAKNLQHLRKKHPTYPYLVQDFIKDPIYTMIRRKVEYGLENPGNYAKKNILYVKNGNCESSDRITSEYNVFVLNITSGSLKLYYDNNIIKSWNLNNNTQMIYLNILSDLKIDIVYMITPVFEIAYVAKIMGLKVLLSLHNDTITEFNKTSPLNSIEDLFKYSDKFITTSNITYELYANNYPEIKDKGLYLLDSDDIAYEYFDVYEKFSEKQSILYVGYDESDAIMHITSDLINDIAFDYNAYILLGGSQQFKLYKFNPLNPDLVDESSEYEFMKRYDLIRSFEVNTDNKLPLIDKHYRMMYKEILDEIDIDIIHIEHLKYHSFDLPILAHEREIKVILTLHDYYYICPSNYLINNVGKYYEGEYNNSDGKSCEVISPIKTPVNKTLQEKWKKSVREMFKNCNVIVVDSNTLHELYVKTYPQLKNQDFKVIENSEKITIPDKIEDKLKLDDKINIFIRSDITPSIAHFLHKIKKHDLQNKLKFHIIGRGYDKYNLSEIAKGYGLYERDKFKKLINRINPLFVGVFNLDDIPNNYELNEAWSCGVPILTFPDLKQTKIIEEGGGFKISTSPRKAYEEIKNLSKNKELYRKALDNIEKMQTSFKMVQEYKKLYENYRKNILYVLHKTCGGVLYAILDILPKIREKYDVYILAGVQSNLYLFKVTKDLRNIETCNFDRLFNRIEMWEHEKEYDIINESIPEFNKIYEYILKEYDISLVHIQHLIFNTFDLPRIAYEMDIKVVLSIHDFYYVCPSHNLLDENSKYCEGDCQSTKPIPDKNCQVSEYFNIPSARKFVPEWRDRVREMFKYISEFTAPSKSTYDVYMKIYSDIFEDKEFNILEPGREINTPDVIDVNFEVYEDDNNPITIMFPGHMGPHKGIDFISKLKQVDVDNKLDLHIVGDYSPGYELEKYTTIHPPYNRHEFKHMVDEIQPQFVGIFSICPEAHCYTLTEAWCAGIPILTFNMGAQAERIKKNGGGFIISQDPQKAYEEILEIAKDKDRYINVTKQITDIEIRSIEEVSQVHMDMYDKYIE